MNPQGYKAAGLSGIGRIGGENLSLKKEKKHIGLYFFKKNSKYDIIAFMYYSTI